MRDGTNLNLKKENIPTSDTIDSEDLVELQAHAESMKLHSLVLKSFKIKVTNTNADHLLS